MKKIFLLTILLAFSNVTYCDIIPENSHSVDKCVKIINSADFPEIVLIAYTEYPGGGSNAFVIEPNSCIEKGYKFNSLKILAIKKSYLTNKNLDSINWKNDKNIFRANIDIESYGGYVDNLTPISSIEEYYKIESFQDSTLVLYKSKEVTKFNNDRPVSIKTFSYKSGVACLDKENSTIEEPYNLTIDTKHTILDFLRALFFTILIETLVLFLLFKTKFKTFNISNKTLLLTGFISTFATLPYLWFVLPIFIQSTIFYIIIGELSVVIIETLIISGIVKINLGKAFIASFVANLTSFLIGLLLDWII